jgi:hypothetical protein
MKEKKLWKKKVIRLLSTEGKPTMAILANTSMGVFLFFKYLIQFL